MQRYLSSFKRIPGLAILAALLWGCQGGETPPDAIHSCQIFSNEEVQALFGPTVELPPREKHKSGKDNGEWMSSCTYYSPVTNLSAGIVIKPFYPHEKTAETASENYVKDIKANLPDYTIREIDDVGAKALWNGESGQLTFFEGKQMVIISIMQQGRSEDEKLAFCRNIAQALIDKNIL